MGKWIAIAVGIAVLLVGGAYAFFYGALPRVSRPPDLVVDRSADKILRGQYLATSVMGCFDCHTRRDPEFFAMPPVRSVEFGGGLEFPREMGLPGTIVSRNITPAALRDWTDGEIVRAITAGVSRDGRVLFPLMPYQTYGALDRDDIYAIVAYLRVIPPVNAPVQPTKVDFPVNLLMRLAPQDPQFQTRPRAADTVKYGRYLVQAAGCNDCHTRHDAQGNESGPPFAGGREFFIPSVGMIRSANITPDTETGIGEWDREQFIDRFKGMTLEDYRHLPVARGEPNTIMPWWVFSGMTRDDLGAIYAYLSTVPPVQNAVVTFEKR